jgi:methionyl-tRNA formyltransferase
MEKLILPKIVFMGSPFFASEILQGLIDKNLIPLAVFTQEDKAGSRGHKIIETYVKKKAKEYSLPVYSPIKLKDEKVIETIKGYSPDFLVVAAYGKILPEEILNVPAVAPVNIHASLLPRWRGASPIQHSILYGDKTTGITVMKMDKGVDTGPYYFKSEEIEIDKKETGETLTLKLAKVAKAIFPDILLKIYNGELKEQEQEGEPTYAGRIKKEDGLIDFNEDASFIERKVRAFYPWPKCYFYLKGVRINVIEAEVGEKSGIRLTGVSLSSDKLCFSCGKDSTIIFTVVQREGKKVLNFKEFLKGFKVEKGDRAEKN